MSPSRQPAKKQDVPRVAIGNPRARHKFELLERLECGLSLRGTEVKSLRLGNGSIDEAYARFQKGELWLLGMYVEEYAARGYASHARSRPRKLLVHRREMQQLRKAVERRGLTMVPTRVYFNERGIVKVEIALARGKKLHDKRQDLKARDAKREIARAARHRGR